MRWVEPTLEIGAVRECARFLWFPMTIDKETRWLEYARWQEQVMKRVVYLNFIPTYWLPDE